MYRNAHLLHDSENSRWWQGQGRIIQGGGQEGCRQGYRTAMDAGTGNRWERKCAESREQELWQWRVEALGWNQHMTAGEEMRRNGRWERRIWQRERELWENVWIQAEGEMKSRRDWQRGWYRPVERNEMESDKEKRRNAVCATTADASQVMIVLSFNRRYRCMYTHAHILKGLDIKTFYFWGQTPALYVYGSHTPSPSLFSALPFFPLHLSSSLSVCIEGSLTGGSVD